MLSFHLDPLFASTVLRDCWLRFGQFVDTMTTEKKRHKKMISPAGGELFTSRYNLDERSWEAAVPFKTINSSTSMFVFLFVIAATLTSAPGIEINSLVSLDCVDEDKSQSPPGSLVLCRRNGKG